MSGRFGNEAGSGRQSMEVKLEIPRAIRVRVRVRVSRIQNPIEDERWSHSYSRAEAV